MKIFVCDDRNPKDICDAIDVARQHGAVIPEISRVFGTEELNIEFPKLFQAVEDTLSGKDIDEKPFDGADLILLDYGLTNVKSEGGPRLTADHVAGYIRAFSTSAYVVSLNRLPLVDFDLSYLVGDFAARADLSLNTEHLEEPGLWNGTPASGAFCPWYWPKLNSAGQRRTEQVNLLLQDLDRPLLDLIGLPDRLVPYLSRKAIAYLSPTAEEGDDRLLEHDVRSVSAWHHFRSSSRTLSKDDRRDLAEAFGGTLKQDLCPAAAPLKRVVARVVAAELDFWFRRDVLGPQRLLADTPHVLAAFPYQSEQRVNDLLAWSNAVRSNEYPFGLDDEFARALPDDSKTDMRPWVERPTFWLPLIEESAEFEAVTTRLKRNNDFCFCEDTRRFLTRDNCHRFATELGGGLDIRFVERLPGKGYTPEISFAS